MLEIECYKNGAHQNSIGQGICLLVLDKCKSHLSTINTQQRAASLLNFSIFFRPTIYSFVFVHVNLLFYCL